MKTKIPIKIRQLPLQAVQIHVFLLNFWLFRYHPRCELPIEKNNREQKSIAK